jgi:hypothetical protein
MNWDEFQDFIKGKYFLIGLSFYDSEKRLLEQYQTSGRVEHITDTAMLVLKREDGSLFTVPYDHEAIRPAAPGEYTENSTGRLIVNPDYILTGDIEVNEPGNIESIKEKGFFPA